MATRPHRSTDKPAVDQPMPATNEARRAPEDAEMPDKVRRVDQQEVTGPEPTVGEDFIPGGRTPAPDGDVDQHPIHDEPMEDFDAEDYEQMADEAQLQFEGFDEEDQEAEDAENEDIEDEIEKEPSR